MSRKTKRMKNYVKNSESGFSMVELLVVMVIMGLVMTSVLGLYLTQQRTANTSDEVIDVQQNLRIAYDMMSRDIRMAGFGHSHPIEVAGGSRLVIRTPSPQNRYARMDGVYDATMSSMDPSTDGLSSGQTYFIKIPATQAQAVRAGHIFRMISPKDNSVYLGGASMVVLQDPYFNGTDWYLKVEMTGSVSAGSYEVGEMGDVLARVPYASYDPYVSDGETMAFELADTTSGDTNQKQLVRVISRDAGATEIERQVLATKIVDDPADPEDGLRFEYLVTDAAGDVTLKEVQWNEDLEADYGLHLDQVVAIQVHLTGATDATATGKLSGVKSREVLGRVHLKNRKIKYSAPE